MEYSKAAAKLIGTLVGSLVASVLVGFVLNVAFDISATLSHLRGVGVGHDVHNVVWCVYGIFVGILLYGWCGRAITPGGGEAWGQRPHYAWRAAAVFAATLGFFALLICFCLRHVWDEGGMFDTPPLNAGTTLAYMIAILLGMILSCGTERGTGTNQAVLTKPPSDYPSPDVPPRHKKRGHH